MKRYFLAALLLNTLSTYAQLPVAATYIDSITDKSHFNGTILLESNFSPIYRKSFGLANMAFNIPNTPDTKYKIASITKAFTAVLVLQLYERGLIQLDTSISTYLQDYKGPAAKQVTIRQLLNMTSGMKNMDAGITLESVLKNGMPQYQLPHTSREMLLLYASDSLLRPPGKQFDYNNAEYIVLGQIIEAVTKKSFEEQLTTAILQPLGMQESGMASQEKIIDNLADTYFYREDLKTLVNDLPSYINNWYAAGAMYATVGDIARFCNALFSGKLLKPATLQEMFHSGLDEYGLGVWVYKNYDINGHNYTIIKRPGSIMGAQAMLFHVLEAKTTIIILSNTANVDMDQFAARIADRLVR
ncbi:CubicO group peptidase, beta-lactamase class C family [Chitinophaga jiangningensis]|uniref:CubicO group peptidase, beta-lactamase class C family n=1 Tax=Chitinophaga jiangningensis TaxID=1419482 RepID=A0A1M7CYZ1_9BACT|nr:serine hydrolase domain-containing protein [Chitinophaga jiangningensis]SHL72448.1 CubicO group peptidase, beta-lactamase class C family [Chitinophaga jiangningensis]